jgi:hypothetical protein
MSILLNAEQPGYVSSGAKNPGSISHQQKSKGTVIPESTKYRYSGWKKS